MKFCVIHETFMYTALGVQSVQKIHAIALHHYSYCYGNEQYILYHPVCDIVFSNQECLCFIVLCAGILGDPLYM